MADGASFREVSNVHQNQSTSSRASTQPARILFVYLAINMLIWLFLRSIEVESVMARTIIPLAITVAVIVPLHAAWLHLQKR